MHCACMHSLRVFVVFLHACLWLCPIHFEPIPGAELKKLFLESGQNWDIVECKVQKWTEEKQRKKSTMRDCTKKMLREIYFWDEPTPKFPLCVFFVCGCLMTSWLWWSWSVVLRSMIEKQWAWASENNKIMKDPINGAEYVNCNVERVNSKLEEQGLRMQQSTGGYFQVGRICRHFVSMIEAVLQDDTGSIMDDIGEPLPRGDAGSAAAAPLAVSWPGGTRF